MASFEKCEDAFFVARTDLHGSKLAIYRWLKLFWHVTTFVTVCVQYESLCWCTCIGVSRIWRRRNCWRNYAHCEVERKACFHQTQVRLLSCIVDAVVAARTVRVCTYSSAILIIVTIALYDDNQNCCWDRKGTSRGYGQSQRPPGRQGQSARRPQMVSRHMSICRP